MTSECATLRQTAGIVVTFHFFLVVSSTASVLNSLIRIAIKHIMDRITGRETININISEHAQVVQVFFLNI